jgi:hypothetical protein
LVAAFTRGWAAVSTPGLAGDSTPGFGEVSILELEAAFTVVSEVAFIPALAPLT